MNPSTLGHLRPGTVLLYPLPWEGGLLDTAELEKNLSPEMEMCLSLTLATGP